MQASSILQYVVTYCFASVLRIEEEDVLVLFVLCDCCRCLRVDQESVDYVIVWKVERGGKSRGRLKKGGARKGMYTNKQGLCSLRRQCTSTFGMFCIPGSVSHVVRWASRSPRLTSTERMPTTPKPVLADAAAQRKTKNQSTTACSAARGQCLGASMPPSLSSETHNFMKPSISATMKDQQKCGVIVVFGGLGLWIMLGGMLTNAAEKTCSAPGECGDGYIPYTLHKRWVVCWKREHTSTPLARERESK